MRFAVLAALLALGACVSVSDIRAKPAYYSGSTTRPSNTVAACIVPKLQKQGTIVSTVPLEDGTSIVQSAQAPQGMTPFVIVDVRSGANTTVEVRVNGPRPKKPDEYFKDITDCM